MYIFPITDASMNIVSLSACRKLEIKGYVPRRQFLDVTKRCFQTAM